MGRDRSRYGSQLDGGATLVEFALVLPLLMALVLGLFTGGLAYNRKISITSAVREGARFGATFACSASCVSAGTLPAQVKQRVVDTSGNELALTDVCVWIGSASGATDCGVNDPGGASGSMVVKVSASRTAKLEVVFFSWLLTLQSRTAARYERAATYGLP